MRCLGSTYKKYILTNDIIVVYLVRGNLILVQILLSWLDVAEDGTDMDSYIFPSKWLRLATEHGLSDDTLLVIDTRMCLEYLTGCRVSRVLQK